MTDLELTKLCAEAMFSPLEWEQRLFDYDPLHNDEQAMALVKRFNVYQAWDQRCQLWETEIWVTKPEPMGFRAWDVALNRAVVEAVARMQVGRTAQEASTVARQDKQDGAVEPTTQVLEAVQMNGILAEMKEHVNRVFGRSSGSRNIVVNGKTVQCLSHASPEMIMAAAGIEQMYSLFLEGTGKDDLPIRGYIDLADGMEFYAIPPTTGG